MIKKEKIRQIFKKTKDEKILSCGDVMLDGYFTGKAERFSQEAPVPVVAVEDEKFSPGGAGNGAACMAAIGVKPFLISIIGSDGKINYNKILAKECSKRKINPLFIKDKERKTTLKLRLAAIKTTKQHIARIDIEDKFELSNKMEEKVLTKIDNTLKKHSPKAITIHDYRKGFLTKKIFKQLMEASSKNNLPVFADLKQETFIAYKNLIKKPELFYLKPNRSESIETARLLNGFNKDGYSDKEIIEVAKIIQKEIPVNIIITRGAKGAVLFEVGQKPFFVKPEKIEEQFDVAGAGDTVEAFLVASWLGGASMQEATEIAIIASQVAIRKFGTSVVSQKEILNWLKNANEK